MDTTQRKARKDNSVCYELTGRILRKKKRYEWFVLAVRKQNSGETATRVFVNREDPHLEFCFLDAVIHVVGIFVEENEKEAHSSSVETADEVTDNDEILTQNLGHEMEHDKNKLKRPEYGAKMIAKSIRLVKCAPDPSAVQLAVDNIHNGLWSMDVLLTRNNHDEALQKEEAIISKLLNEIPSLQHRQRRLCIAKIVRHLKNMTELERSPRQRLPHTHPNDLQFLHDLYSSMESNQSKNNSNINTALGPYCQEIKHEKNGAGFNLYQPVLFHSSTNSVRQKEQQQNDHDFPLNLPHVVVGEGNHDNDQTNVAAAQQMLLSRRGKKTRFQYLQDKKKPQVEWMVERVRHVLAANENKQNHDEFVHILDVGGGRGDLATAIAVALPQTRVTVVDLNASSLEAGKEYAAQLGVAHRMTFLCADFADLVFAPTNQKTSLVSPVDLVVALHACGELSDLALEFASQQQRHCSFVICPCCYTKRCNILTTAGQNDKQYTNTAASQFRPSWHRAFNHDDQRIKTLCKLAELNERPLASKKAMTIINSLRIDFYKNDNLDDDNDTMMVQLEEYQDSYSLRNLVLVGQNRQC